MKNHILEERELIREFISQKKDFSFRVAEHWNQAAREAAESPSLEMLENLLDVVLGNLL